MGSCGSSPSIAHVLSRAARLVLQALVAAADDTRVKREEEAPVSAASSARHSVMGNEKHTFSRELRTSNDVSLSLGGSPVPRCWDCWHTSFGSPLPDVAQGRSFKVAESWLPCFRRDRRHHTRKGCTGIEQSGDMNPQTLSDCAWCSARLLLTNLPRWWGAWEAHEVSGITSVRQTTLWVTRSASPS